MSSPSFTKFVKHAIIMQEKSGLMEKWPLDTKEEHKRTTDKFREFELCNAPTMQNVTEPYSWGIDSYLSITHHKPSSLNNLQCQSSCSNLVSIPKKLIYNYFKTGAD